MSRRRRIVWTARARENLRSIRDYVRSDSPRAADQLIRRFRESVHRISQYPEAGIPIPEVEDDAVRETFVASYRIVYRYDDIRVEVVTVRHAARRLGLDD